VPVVLSGAVLVAGAAVPVVLFPSRRVRVLVRVTVPVRMAVRRAIRMGVLVRMLVFVLVRVIGHGRLRTRGEPDGTGARRRDPARSGRGGMFRAVEMGARERRPGVLRGVAFGVPFEARVDDRRLLPEVRLRCPPGWQVTRRKPRVVLELTHEVSDTSDRNGRGLSVNLDGQTVATRLGHTRALDVFESELQLRVARFARPEVFVHAGVVAVRGRAVVIPGTSGSGKTTLVRALVEAGATYYSDEYAVIDAQGRVHPYARRPSVRGRRGWKRRDPVPRRVGRQPVLLGLVISTEYSSGARWNPVPLSSGERVLALLSHTVPARDRPREVLATLARAVARSRGFRTPRGSAGSAARALVALAALRPRDGSLGAWPLPAASSRAVGRAVSLPRNSRVRRSSTSRPPTEPSV